MSLAIEQDLRLALGLMNCGDLAGASDVCDIALRKAPTDFNALHLAGVIALQRNDTPTACKYLARAVRRNDKSAEAWFHFGVAQIDGHDVESAVRAFRKAVLVNGEMVQALYNLAKALAALGKLQEALAYYDRVIAIEPRHLDARTNRGALYLAIGRRLDAIDDWKVCLQINPRWPFARGNLLHHAMLTCAWEDFGAQIRQIEADIVSGVPAASPFQLLMTPLSGEVRSEATKLFVDAAIPAHLRIGRGGGYGRGDAKTQVKN